MLEELFQKVNVLNIEVKEGCIRSGRKASVHPLRCCHSGKWNKTSV